VLVQVIIALCVDKGKGRQTIKCASRYALSL
jgi:hypothetical protein